MQYQYFKNCSTGLRVVVGSGLCYLGSASYAVGNKRLTNTWLLWFVVHIPPVSQAAPGALLASLIFDSCLTTLWLLWFVVRIPRFRKLNRGLLASLIFDSRLTTLWLLCLVSFMCPRFRKLHRGLIMFNHFVVIVSCIVHVPPVP